MVFIYSEDAANEDIPKEDHDHLPTAFLNSRSKTQEGRNMLLTAGFENQNL